MTTIAQKFAVVKKLLDEAEVGKGGLKRIQTSYWRVLSMEQKRELLEQGPIIQTGDGNDALVEMKAEDYFALCPATQVPGRNPRMMRIDGVLFREVL